MASITQKINSVNGGISQQPDELKLAGQVVTAKNVFPDITHGLQKRPGSKLISSLSHGTLNSYTSGKWFSYYRDESEQYIGQVIRRKNEDGSSHADDGKIRMWRCSDGQEMVVTGNTGDKLLYLIHSSDDDIQTLTLNDFTFICNRSKQTAMLTGVNDVEAGRPPEAFIDLKQIKYASQYAVNLYDQDGSQSGHYTSVRTATRIEVERIIDSSNSCQPPTAGGSSYASSGSGRGQFPQSGTLPGTGAYTTMCNNQGDYSDSNHSNLDSYCPNVATRIFKISHNGAIASADNNGVGGNYVVNLGAGASGAAADREDLYLRITTTGQSVAQGVSATPEYHCRYTTTHDLLHGGTGWGVNDYVDVWMKNARYRITIKEISTMSLQANLGLLRPSPTSFDNETTVTAESILGSIRAEIDTSLFEIKEIGTGLYIKRNPNHADADKVFSINTSQGELLNVMTNEVQDVADLPQQCHHGYVVKVKNSANDEDDYYLRFVGRTGASGNLDGAGVWEECAKPGRAISFDQTTMPLQLVRRFDDASGTNTGTAFEKYFSVEHIPYDSCQVGDSTTAPKPSFISTVAGTDEDTVTSSRTINNMVFFRNRLVFLSDENVIMSRPGDFFNFWPKSAIVASAEDNIDISASSEYPAILFDGIQVNSGLLLFTKNQQFMLTTDSDVLSPLTAKINAMSTYNFNHQTNPISLGTTIAFLDNAGKFTRMFEMASVLREGEPVILEQSVVISKLFPKNINLIANSRENSFIVFAEKDQNKIYGFRYFTSGEKRIMQSWITWELSGNIQHLCMLDDSIFAVVRNGTTDVLQRFNLKSSSDNTESITDNNVTYKVYLDNIKAITCGSYDTSTGKTTFAKPNGFDSDKQLAVYDIDIGDSIGQYAKVTVNQSDPNIFEINGNWSGQTCLLGYLYDMEVEFPKFYVTQQSGDKSIADVQSNLIIHRIKFNFGPLGLYETNLTRVGKTDYNDIFESTYADQYSEGEIPVDPEHEVTVPIYERNTNYTLTLKSSHPTPATLYSMAWEGDYSNTFYKRV